VTSNLDLEPAVMLSVAFRSTGRGLAGEPRPASRALPEEIAFLRLPSETQPDRIQYMKRICVFCGSSSGSRPEYRGAGEELGAELVRRNIGLVYGGGNVGLMGVLADAVLKAGGEVIGVIPENLMAKEAGHSGLTKLHVVCSMHERKALMADLSDAFIALPGGFGTLEEFCEIVTWSQLGLHTKPCGVLNVQGYYSPLLAMFDHAVKERFLKPENRALVLAQDSVPGLLRALREWRPVRVEKWLDRERR
jgi:uncharacterized protein (TIGR00730 family)